MPKQVYPKVSFYIDTYNANKDKRVPIRANITVKGKKIKKIIDHCLQSDWNDIPQRVVKARPGKNNGSEIINEKLDKIQNDFLEFARQCDLKKTALTPDLIKRFLSG